MAERAQRKTPDSSRRSERSRRAIHDAALSLIGEVGYAKTTIEGIAARAGVGKQTIYRWWPSKAAVLLEAFLDLSERAMREEGQAGEAGKTGGAEEPGAAGEPEAAGEREAADGAYAIPDTGDLETDLKRVLRATVDQMNDPRFEVPSRALAAEGIVNAELGTEFARRMLEPQLQLYVHRLTAAQAEGVGGVRRGIDLRIALELLVGPIAHRWMLRTAPLTHAYADTVVEYALYGLAPRP